MILWSSRVFCFFFLIYVKAMRSARTTFDKKRSKKKKKNKNMNVLIYCSLRMIYLNPEASSCARTMQCFQWTTLILPFSKTWIMLRDLLDDYHPYTYTTLSPMILKNHHRYNRLKFVKKGGGVVIIFLNASGKWTGFTLFWTSSFNMLSLTYNRSAGVCTSTIQLSTIIFHFVVRQWNHKQTNEKKKKMLERQIRRFDYRSDKSRWGERFLMSFKTLTPWAGTSWKTIILVWVLDFLWVQLIISSSGSSLVGKNSWWGLIGSSSSSVVMLTTRVGSHKSWNFQSASISDGD